MVKSIILEILEKAVLHLIIGTSKIFAVSPLVYKAAYPNREVNTDIWLGKNHIRKIIEIWIVASAWTVVLNLQ